LQAPTTLASGLAFVAAMFGALLLSCAITNLMNISLLWTISGEGITGLVPALVVQSLVSVRAKVDLREDRLVSLDPATYESVEITDPRLEEMLRDQKRIGD
jgi:hypothetical protein